MPTLLSKGDLPWQRAAVCKLAKVKRAIVWARCGEGKSRVAIRLASKSLPSDSYGLVVVVCSPKAFYDWENQIAECGYDWKIEEFYKDYVPSVKRHSCLLISIGMLHKLWTRLTHYEISAIILDELYLYSNAKSRRTKAASQLVQYTERVYGISGTIMPARDNLTIWGQTYALGLSKVLAKGVTDYRERYQKCFLMETSQRKFPVWSNRAGSEKTIHRKLEPYTYLHFPEVNRIQLKQKISEIPATKEQKQIIKQLKEEYYADLKKGHIEIKVALELIIQIQRISNGYVFNSDGEREDIKTNKISALNQSVSELIAANQQCLIWCAFRADLEILSAKLEFASLQMSGGNPLDIDAWKSGKFPVAIATEGSGASVNHFSNVQYAKYFSMSPRWVDLQQSQGRTSRADSIHTQAHYEFYFVSGTLDRHTYEIANKSGATENDFIKQGILKKWIQQS